jgi:hypothetical protein
MFHVCDKYSLALLSIFPEKNHSNMGDVPRLSDKYSLALLTIFPEKNHLNMSDVLCA